MAALVDAAGKSSRAEAVAPMRINTPATNVEDENIEFSAPNLNDPITRFERQVLEVLVQVPDSYTKDELVHLVKVGFSAPAHNSLLEAIGSSLISHGDADWLAIINSATDDRLHPLLRAIGAQNLPARNQEELIRYGRGVISRALVNALAHEKAELLAQLRRAESDQTDTTEISRKLMQIENQRRKLQGI